MPYDAVNKPYLDYCKDVDREVSDWRHRLAALFRQRQGKLNLAIIRGMGVPTPPETNKGISMSVPTSSGSCRKARSTT